MFKDRLQKFSIRKLTVGAASVLIGTAFFVSGNNSEVKADTTTDTATEQQDTHNTETAGDSANTDGGKTTDVSGNEQTNNVQDAGKVEEGIEPKTTPKVAKLIESGAPTSEGTSTPNNDKPDTKTPDLASSKNYGVDPVLYADNGGYDKTIWGTMNVDDWKLIKDDNDINGYDIDGYTGDTTHIIIPNSSDFIKAGKLTDGQTVEISSKKMSDLVHSTDPSKATQTIAISLNGNSSDNKVKAKDENWSSTFSDVPATNVDLSHLDTSNVNNFNNIFNGLGASTLNISNWDFSKANNQPNPDPSIDPTNLGFGDDIKSVDIPFLNDKTKEIIAGNVNGTFNGEINKNVIIATDATIGTGRDVKSNIYLVNNDDKPLTTDNTLTVDITMPNVILSHATTIQGAHDDILDYLLNKIKNYIDNYYSGKSVDTDTLKTGNQFITIDSIAKGPQLRTKLENYNDYPDSIKMFNKDDYKNDKEAYTKISQILQHFYDVSDSSELYLNKISDDDLNDPQNHDYPNLPLIAAVHGEFVKKVDNSGSGYYPSEQDTTPDTPNTTPDTPNTDNNGDQGKEPNNSNKGDNDKHDHGNKGTGSATSTNTNTGRNTGSVTNLDNSGAGSNKSVNGNDHDNELPQTGEKETSMASVFGLAAIALGGLMGLAGDRKKKRN